MLTSGGEDPRKSAPQSALDAANAYAMPSVGNDNQDRLTLSVGAAALMMLGVFVFNQLSAERHSAALDQSMAQTRQQLELAQNEASEARAAAARAQVDADRARRQSAVPARQTAAAAPRNDARTIPAQASLRSPALVVDNSRPAAPSESEVGDGGGAKGVDLASLTASDVFAQRVSAGGLEPVTATIIEDLSRVIPQGAIVSGVLETAINSDLPGFARAVVSDDVRSLDNRNILIPRGSRLIGQYRSGLAIGESRVFVIWTRLLTPSGVSVELTSPATDTLGRAGLAGDVNRHFFQRFGSSILLSVIGVAANALAYESSSTIVIGSTSEAHAIAAQALSQQINIPPTITVDQGSEIRIFLARDLFFPKLAQTSELRP